MDKDQELIFDDEARERQEPNEPDDAGSYDSEDDDHKYLMTLLDYLEDAVDYGSVVPLTNKRLVDAKMCKQIIQDIRDNLPPAIQYAQQVKRDRERILKNAEATAANKLSSADVRANAAIDDSSKRAQQMLEEAASRADKIIKDAEIRARAMVDQNAIKVAAQNEAREIVNDARADANERRLDASAYGEQLLMNVEKELQRAMDMVKNRRKSIGDGNID